MTSMYALLALTLTCLVCVKVTKGWSLPAWTQPRQDIIDYYRSHNMRRAGYWSCTKTGQECNEDNKCCSHRDTCFTEYSGQGLVSVCKDLSDVIEAKQRKIEGQECKTSHECADLCCREYRGHRQARRLRCGKQDEGGVIFHNCV